MDAISVGIIVRNKFKLRKPGDLSALGVVTKIKRGVITVEMETGSEFEKVRNMNQKQFWAIFDIWKTSKEEQEDRSV